ncbi:MAG: HPP family protein [Proteobacteria bacterium]|nr:HPP family protein [Pseudomonadota bacterium]
MRVNTRERLRAACGAGLGVAFTGLVCLALAPPGTAVWMVGPVGASAVLVFCVPASPLAQPWSVIGGNTMSAIAGIGAVHLFGSGPIAVTAGAAVLLSIVFMFALRCLHPPGGATGLTMALTHTAGFAFAAQPVLLNCVLLVVAGIAYNSATGRRYPHSQAPAPKIARTAFNEGDLDAALARYNQVLDVPRDDLRTLLADAELGAYRRRMGDVRCVEIMSRNVATVSFGTLLQEAWTLLRERHVKALPVVDRAGLVIGILTLSDFMRGADLDVHEGFDTKLRRLIRKTPLASSDKPEVVGQLMARDVRVANADQLLADLVPMFATTGHHHIPIVDGSRKLVGIVTQTDLVAALLAHPGAR